MDNKLKIGLAVIGVLLVAGFVYVFSGSEEQQATAVNCQVQTCFTDVGITNTLTVDGTATFNGTVVNAGNASVTGNFAVTGTSVFTGDVTMNGGDGALVITTTNTATSSVEVGCVQMTATSTASPIKLVFTDTATTTKAGPNGTTANGFALWQYGTCP